jgi:hypothetical protein
VRAAIDALHNLSKIKVVDNKTKEWKICMLY